VATPRGAGVCRRRAPPAPRRACAFRDRGAPSIRSTWARTVTLPLRDGLFRHTRFRYGTTSRSRTVLRHSSRNAVAEYLHRHAPDDVTEAMNQVIDKVGTAPDPFVQASAQSVLARVEW